MPKIPIREVKPGDHITFSVPPGHEPPKGVVSSVEVKVRFTDGDYHCAWTVGPDELVEVERPNG